MACLPQLIGFHPHESLVLVGMVPAERGRPASKRQVGLTLRIDLDAVVDLLDPLDTAEAIDPFDIDEFDDEIPDEFDDQIGGLPLAATPPGHPAGLVDALERNGCVGALMVLVTDRVPAPPHLDDNGPVAEVINVVSAHLDVAGIDLSDVLLVTEGRWWSYFCHNPACCPPEGTPVSRADSDLYTAELAWNGESAPVLPSRSALQRKVARDTTSEADQVAEAVAHLAADGPRPGIEAVGGVSELLQRFRAQDRDVPPELWARVLVDLTDVLTRDGCLPTWKGQVGEAALDLWCAATRVAPAGFVAPPATLASMLAHARGDGALAACAIDRALTDDPTYRLARYANRFLGGGIPPTTIRRMMVETASSMRSKGMPVLDRRGRLVTGGRSDDSVTPAGPGSGLGA